jgi:hypothetical protein
MNNNSEIVWACPLTKTGKKSKAKDAHAKCAQQFANERKFELIHTADNGDCFFNTLTKFAILTDNRELLRSNNTHYDAKYDMDGHPNDMILRKDLVNHIEDNLQDYIFYINNSNASVESQLHSLRKSGVWDTSIGDLVVPIGANALHININLYNIEENKEGKDIIKLTKYKSQDPSDVYVNIIRVNDGHFELLLPFSNQNIKNRNQVEEQNNSRCTEEAVSAALIATKAAQVAMNYAKKLSNNSQILILLNKNEKNMENMTNELEKLSMTKSRRSSRLSAKNKNSLKKSSEPSQSRSSRSTRSMSRATQNKKRENQNTLNKSYKPKTKRTTRKKKINNNNNNNNMRAAIEASLRNQYN